MMGLYCCVTGSDVISCYLWCHAISHLQNTTKLSGTQENSDLNLLLRLENSFAATLV